MLGMPISIVTVAILITSIGVKSFGALVLLMVGLAVLWMTSMMGSRVAVLALAAIPIGYVGARATNVWDGSQLVAAARIVGGEDRAGSVGVRVRNDGLLAAHAIQRPLFGWGGWDRHRPVATTHRVITDSLWAIVMGQRGLVGLAALGGGLLLGYLRVFVCLPPRLVSDSRWAATASMGVVLGLFVVDCLFNAMWNPVFVMIAGAIGEAPASWSVWCQMRRR